MEKIAIVKLSALGDIIHAMVALQFIHQHFPKLQIDWLVDRRFAEILHYNPHIRSVLPIDLKDIKHKKWRIFEQVRWVRQFSQENYDLIIDAQGLLKSAIAARLLGKNIAGFNKYSIREPMATFFYHQKIDFAYEENTIERNITVLSHPLGFCVSEAEILAKTPFLFFQPDLLVNEFLHPHLANILFVIGSTWASRNYPPEKFAEVANILKQNALIIYGTENERLIAQKIAEKSPYVQIIPKLDLNALKMLISKVDLVIGNDTGPTHMAWGLNKPSITLFGCTPVNRVYQTDINRVLKSSSVVNPRKLNKQDDSVKTIDVNQIVNLSINLLNDTRSYAFTVE